MHHTFTNHFKIVFAFQLNTFLKLPFLLLVEKVFSLTKVNLFQRKTISKLLKKGLLFFRRKQF